MNGSVSNEEEGHTLAISSSSDPPLTWINEHAKNEQVPYKPIPGPFPEEQDVKLLFIKLPVADVGMSTLPPF